MTPAQLGWGATLLSILAIVTAPSLAADVSATIQAIASATLSVGLAVLLVNHHLNSSERRMASGPLLEMINDHVAKYHNDLFIQRGRDTFGTERWNALIDVYQRHGRSAEAFEPKDRDAIFAMLLGQLEAVKTVLSRLEPQIRELIQIVGWSFDPKLVAIAVKARLSMQKLIHYDGDVVSNQEKADLISAFFDTDGASGTVVSMLAARLGVKHTTESKP